VTFSGPFSPPELKRAIDATAKTCNKTRRYSVLFDQRLMNGEIPVLDRFELGVYVAKRLPRGTRVALVAREDQVHPERFFERVVNNRDLSLRIFSNPGKAVDWLRGYGEDRSGAGPEA
jgi:hypothetical protein